MVDLHVVFLFKQLHSSVRTGNLETCLRLLSLGARANYFHPVSTDQNTCKISVKRSVMKAHPHYWWMISLESKLHMKVHLTYFFIVQEET